MKIFLILLLAILGFNFHVIYAQSISIGANTNEKLTIKAGGSLRFKGMLLSPSIDFTLVQNNISHASILSHSLSSTISSSYSLENQSLPFSGYIKFFYKDLDVKNVLEANLKLVCYSITDWITPTQTESNTTLNFVEAKLLNRPISEITLTAPPLIEEESEGSGGSGGGVNTDIDGDGYLNVNDVFPLDSNEWKDTDSDGIGNNADTDDDNDGQLDTGEIACGSDPLIASSMSLDTDVDGIPDCVDTDDDNDGYLDTNDAFPLDATQWLNTATDGSGNNVDTDDDNSGQLDTDSDGIGNNTDTDDDNDGQLDTDEIVCGSNPLLASSVSLDADGDSVPDCVDTDDDDDGVEDTSDAFPVDPSEWTDTDADGIGNNADGDDDNDGQSDFNELMCGSDPLLASSMSLDTDFDLIPNCKDTDDDNDSYLDEGDAFPLDLTEWLDKDLDGIGNNADTDDDNDGQSDYNELMCGSDPLLASSMSLDTDGDSVLDCVDTDDDNDGVVDTSDAFPLDPNEWTDADNDGLGDNADPDDNNDGFEDDKLFSSSILTPGSGGLEDTWKIINIAQYPINKVSVYDKKGQEVFSATNYKNNWRGTFKNSGNPLPAGSYYYVVDLNNAHSKINGWLYITY